MLVTAAASSELRAVLAGPAQRATWLGVTPKALYLAVGGQPGVLAVLAHDAIRLPSGLVLASTSPELPLTTLAPGAGDEPCLVGGGIVRWTGRRGPVIVRVAREWAPCRATPGNVVASALASAQAAVRGADCGLDGRLLAGIRGAVAPAGDAAAVVADLLGRGPGLTPSGDDVLAGFLVGAYAFGLDVPELRAAVAGQAPTRTTALSAALLWHAARGQCIDELAALAAALTGRGEPGQAARRLLAVGHTSGAALAGGLLLASALALRGDMGGYGAAA